ncbi:protein translocase subunit SecF [Helicobacter monodelphidis]|uniref:protein translocase subunit SecF n=1 Tax=Helicobacter sp. 15-1451 TaxID=2004995 RepID=UPI000DCC38AB|nr:protein translocase subunit SecF [Helicobacter sp. 15-1451]RAX57904.1 protein translocase subunit SecF [Helicobacter sp. 15-1451]
MELFRNNHIYNFMGLGKYAATFSAFLIILSFFLFFYKGFNYGIDFNGGSIIQLQYTSQIAPIAKIRDYLESKPEYKGVQVSEYGSPQEVMIKLPTTNSQLTGDTQSTYTTKITEELAFTGDFSIRRSAMVGPKVGDELRQKGTIALLLASLGILAYVAFRYEWRFAIAAVLALMHDVIIACGAVIIFNVDFGLDVVAALLTLLGYSINDTIIIFDRIRERMQKDKSFNLKEVMNEAISRTLSRTVLTSLTTMFTVATLFFFGGEIIRGFSLPMLVGVIVGSYSSIFIAALFVLWLGFDLKKYRENLVLKEKQKLEKQKLRASYAQGRI